jgi:MFS transporter, DHA1 family, multidrug resistance protein
VASRDYCDERLVGKDPVGEVGRQLITEKADECDVQFARPHLLGHVHAAGVADGDFDDGMSVMEGRKSALHGGCGVTVLAVAIWRTIPETLPPEQRHTGGLRNTGRAFIELGRDRVFCGYALTVAFAYASLFGYISGSPFALQEVFGLSATQFSLVFALNAVGMILLGLLNARLVRRFPIRRLLVLGLAASTVAAVVLVVMVACGLGVLAVLAPLFLVVASRGLISANATVLGVERAPAAGAASAVLGACMFGGGIIVSPLMALGGEGTAIPMAVVVAGGAVAALLATVLMTRGDHPEPVADANVDAVAQPIEE